MKSSMINYALLCVTLTLFTIGCSRETGPVGPSIVTTRTIPEGTPPSTKIVSIKPTTKAVKVTSVSYTHLTLPTNREL